MPLAAPQRARPFPETSAFILQFNETFLNGTDKVVAS